MKQTKKGFTLVELIVVLAILAVIAAIAVPTAFGAIDKAKFAADQASIEGYNSAIRVQGTMLSAGTLKKDDPENAVSMAITNGKISDTNVQSSKAVIAWVAPTGSEMGHLTIVEGTTGAAKAGVPWKTVVTAAVTAAGKGEFIVANPTA